MNSLTIFWHSLKRQLRGARWYGVGLFIYSWMLLAVWPTMEHIDLNQYLAMFPEEFLQFFGGGATTSLSTIEGFLSLEYLALFFVLIIGFHLASSAGSAIAGAIETRVMDFTLTQPVSRTSFLTQEILAATVSTMVLVWFGIGSMMLQAAMYDVSLSTAGLVSFGIVASVFMWMWIGLAFFFSSFVPSKMMVAASTLGIMIASYTLTALGGVSDKLEAVSKLSPFRFYNPSEIIQTQTISANHVLILLAVGLAGALLAGLIFNRRDV